jgi:molybdopterin molybdotransferase
MVTPDEALRIVLEKTSILEAVEVPLAEAVGAVLAEAVTSDMDLPPFDKSAMDGYAVRGEDVARLPVELSVVEELAAGSTPSQSTRPGTCAKIMTGAPVPEGADVVIPVENTESVSGGRVRILRADVAHRNICVRGEDTRKGAEVLPVGRVLGPPEMGLMASVGREKVSVYRRPRVAVLATGDELVKPSCLPGPGRIRNANSSILLGCCRLAGVPADDLGIARDNRSDLRAKIAQGLERDVLLVSGGVSTGEWDLVPGVFDEMGATTHFATVQMKPGRPTVFATKERRVIFGLPGNPVSTLVTFRLFVWPCLRKMMGHPQPAPAPVKAVLASAASVRGDRVACIPAKLRREADRWTVELVETRGSADLVGFCRADALAILEPGRYDAGSPVDALPLAL